MELLESVGLRPRQARYQAALRPDAVRTMLARSGELLEPELLSVRVSSR